MATVLKGTTKLLGNSAASVKIAQAKVNNNLPLVGGRVVYTYLPIATRERCGGVIIGDGIDVREDGKISLEAVSDELINEICQ